MSRRFIAALTGNAQTKVTWQYFMDKKLDESAIKFKPAGHQHSDHRTSHRNLEKKQGDGCGVFIMVNEGDGKGRKAENVVRVRALFIDLDGAPIEPAASQLKPHIVVESSPNRFHLYWFVSDCPLDQFTPVQKAIAQKFNGDKSCVDLPRVLRVPGFYHLKGEPFMTRLLEANDHPAYTVAEIIDGLSLNIHEALPKESLSRPSSELRQHPDSADASNNIPDIPVSEHTSSIPLARPKDSSASHEYVNPATGEVFSLKEFAVKNPDFQIVDALSEHSPQVILGEPKDGKQHIRCPFEHEHTRQGEDRATFCVNGETSITKGFVIQCLHDHCSGRDRLEHLRAMLSKGWLPVDVLSGQSHVLMATPEWCAWYEADFSSDARVNSLTPREKVYWRAICTMMLAEGSLTDDDWMLSRNLGLNDGEWQELKGTYGRTGLLRSDEGRLTNTRAYREFSKAQNVYDKKVRGGRKGGSGKGAGHAEPDL
jgi:hypothetical protein